MPEYRFKIQHARFSAEVAVDDRCSLYALAQLLIQAVGFDFDHCFQFCDNLREPYQSEERYTLFADVGEGSEGDRSVKKTRVSSVFHPKRKMIFHFDYGDDWYFLVTCTSVQASHDRKPLRKVISTRGKPPVQYPGREE